MGRLRNRHKIIEAEMDRNDTRRVNVKRANLKFKKEHLQGFALIESEVDQKTQTEYLPRGYQKAAQDKFDLKKPICT